MENKVVSNDVFGFVKPRVDVHTMGIYTIANLLRDCGYKVILAKDDVNEAIEKLQKINNYSLFKQWLLSNKINRIGFSYRLECIRMRSYFIGMSLYVRFKILANISLEYRA